jgi:hypothetical protein
LANERKVGEIKGVGVGGMGQKTEMTIMKNSRRQYLQKTTKEIKASNIRQ